MRPNLSYSLGSRNVFIQPACALPAMNPELKKEKKELLFISVIGIDKKGIVANVSMFLYKNDINIEDIAQKIMKGHFVMTMLVDMSGCSCSLDAVRQGLDAIGKDMGLKIQIQHENIFKMMHRV